jgi:hypothetical protein
MSIFSVYLCYVSQYRYLQYTFTNCFLNHFPFHQGKLLTNFLRPLLHQMYLFSSVSPRLILSVTSLTADQRTVSFPLRGQLTFLVILLSSVKFLDAKSK